MYIFIIILSVIVYFAIKLIESKRKDKEIKYLINIFTIACNFKTTDWYELMEQLEKNADKYSETIKKIRIERIKGIEGETKIKNDIVEKVFFNAIEIAYKSSLKRGGEYVALSEKIISGKEKRINSIRMEVVNGVGILLAIAQIFIIAVYFLEPLMKIAGNNIF